MAKKKVFSGVQPTGDLHIGNYLGAIRNWVVEAEQYESIFCVVDLHAITVPQDPKTLHEKSREIAKFYIAAGIDPKDTPVFIQSHVREHTELAWIFNCLTPMGWANRMTQYKEKSADKRDQSSVGLLAYPMLMAADILLYQVDGVPVGEDQKQHVELTRDIAEKFNREYGQTFVVPDPYIKEEGARIMALDEPTKKMSKSGAPGNSIQLLDPPDTIRKKIMRATTDSNTEIRFDEARPGIYNLLTIYQLLQKENLSREQIEAKFEGQGYGTFKKDLAEVVVEGLRPLQTKFAELSAEPQYIEEILKDSADRVRPIADKTVTRVKELMGLS
jgi:tryptophanyl-tRNA synthetase